MAPIVPTACLRVRYTKYAFTRLVHQPPAYIPCIDSVLRDMARARDRGILTSLR